MASVSAPKGAADVLPAEVRRWHAVERAARETAERYRFAEIRTPEFEHSELFHRGVGEASDIVTKETYTFDDRGGRSITLRPEGTAGVVRAVIEHGLLNDAGARVKVYYLGANFRYERPQAGRLRIHHQFGVEAFGIAEPEQDVECIQLQLDFYRQCGLRDVSLQINSLGDAESKQRYRDALVGFLQPRAAALSDESQRRLATNPLRILDSKDPRDREACAGAPPAVESLSARSLAHFERAQALLRDVGVAFEVAPGLVRGFDYYTETLWEVTAGGLGAQNAVGGGGRYDRLVEHLGGRPTPGVGFGAGLERLLLALEAQQAPLRVESPRLIWVVVQSPGARAALLPLLRDLRDAGFAADADLGGRSVKSQFKLADREGAAVCLILGDNEIASGTVAVKAMGSGQQQNVPRDGLVDHLRGLAS